MKLLEFIETSVSPFHTVESIKTELASAGFQELNMQDEWELKKGQNYMVAPYRTGIFAFSVGKDFEKEDGFRLAAAHGDFPGFRIKPNPEMNKEGYLVVNTEVYGSPNLASWMDRPLSAAGMVALKSKDVFHPELRLLDLKQPFFIIPSLAIHLNREVNKGVEIKRQIEMLPIACMAEENQKKDWFLSYLAQHLDVEVSDILDYELQVYNADKPLCVGMNQEFLSAPRLDNVTSVYAITKALKDGKRNKGINLFADFDHEEVGSRSKEGAESVLISQILEKIYLSLGYTALDCHNALLNSILFSVDVSQGYHPAHGEKFDPTNRSILGKGFSIKQANRQSYVTDTEAIAIVKQICEKEDIPYQNYLNHSDVLGGSTLGVLAVKNVPVKAVDVGVPMLAMHSARELICMRDQESMERMLQAYFPL